MSSTDTRIVQMKFDNAQFLQGSQQTQDSMTKLKASLNVDGQSASLQNLQDVGNHFSLASMGEALDSISSKFGAMGAIGFSVLNSITDQALQTGESMLNALVDPLIEGGKQRSLNISQAQFQFQALGLDVTSTMASALSAVKGTAYSLDQAALAAANFGAAGVKSGTQMTDALTAVSGVAAITGKSYSQIADIFTTVAGDGRLMGEQLLQLSDNGVDAAAVLAKSLGKTEAQVRAMVTAGKISFQQFSDAMYNAFGEHAKDADLLFSGALANMQAAAARIGQTLWDPILEGERRIFNAVGPALDNLNTAVQPLITAFGTLFDSNSDNLVVAIHNIDFTALTEAMPTIVKLFNDLFTAVRAVVLPLKEAFEEIFPPTTAKTLISIVTYLDDLVKGMTIAGTNAENLRKTFAGVFAIFDIAGQIIEAVVKAFFNLIGYTGTADSSILSFTGSVGQFLVNLDAAIKKGQGFVKFFQTLADTLRVPIELITNLVGIIIALGKSLFTLNPKPITDFMDVITTKFQGVIAFWNGVKVVLTDIQHFFEAVFAFISPVVYAIISLFTTMGQKIGAALGDLNFTQALNLINTGLLGGFVLLIRGFFGNIGGIVQGNGVAFVTKFKTIMNQVQTTFKAFEYNLNAKTLLAIASAIALLTVSVLTLSLINPVKLAVSLNAMVGMIAALVGALAIMKKMEGVVSSGGLIAMALALNLLAGAVNVLVIAIVILSKLDWVSLAKGLSGMIVILGALIGFSAAMKKIPTLLVSEGLALIALAGAVAILANAVISLSSISWEGLAKGLSSLTLLLGALVGYAALLNKIPAPLLISEGLAILTLSGAIAILSGVVAALSKLSWESLAKGLLSVAAIMAAFAGFSQISDFGPEFILASVGLVIMATAISMVAKVVEDLGTYDWVALFKGLYFMSAALYSVVGALLLIEPSDLVGAVALVVAAAALIIIANAMNKMGQMPWDNIGRAFVVMAGSLILLTAALILLGDPLTLIGAAALIIAAGALIIIAGAMKIFGSLSWDQIGRALTLMAASFVIMAVGGVLLLAALPGFLGFGLALILIGTGVKALGNGVLTLAKGLLLLAGAGGAGALAIGLLLAAITKALPKLGYGIGAMLVNIATTLATDAPKLITAFDTILGSMLDSIVLLAPKIVNTGITIISLLLNTIDVLVPQIINTGYAILLAFLQGIDNNIEPIVSTALGIIANFINGIAAGLPQLAQAGVNLVISFINTIANTIGDPTNQAALRNAIESLAESIISGLTAGLLSKAQVSKVLSAVKTLVEKIPAAIREILGIASPSKVTTELGEFTGQGLVNGMLNTANDAANAGTVVGNSAITALKKTISGIALAPSLMDSTPTIKPVLDLTNVKKQASLIPGMLTTTPLALSIGTSTQEAASTAVSMQATQDAANQNGSDNSETAQTILNYTQNNNSPVALSPIEVYRQTNNQLSKKVKELANA